MRKIFITGATGFIGSKLALHLAEQGHTVHALVRSLEKAKKLEHKNICIFQGDILDRPSIDKAIAGCEQVYHVAALLTAWNPDPEESFRVNAGGAVQVLEAAIAAGVKRLVLTSSSGVMGPTKGEPLHEESIRITDYFHDYESAKFIAEERILRAVMKGLIEAVIVLPSRVYGPELYKDSSIVTSIVNKYINGRWKGIPGDGTKYGNYVYLDDVVEGHILAMEKGRNGERYVLGGDDVSWDEFFDTVKEIAGVSYRLWHLPVPVSMGIGKSLVFWHKLTGKLPRITPNVVSKYLYDWKFSSKKAKEELGFSITPFKEGMKKTLKSLGFPK